MSTDKPNEPAQPTPVNKQDQVNLRQRLAEITPSVKIAEEPIIPEETKPPLKPLVTKEEVAEVVETTSKPPAISLEQSTPHLAKGAEKPLEKPKPEAETPVSPQESLESPKVDLDMEKTKKLETNLEELDRAQRLSQEKQMEALQGLEEVL